jgi:demethylmenaquinone methyltransferase/2-methoxy-6-polyprenyl-1,4-benzoquinol methylase
MSDRDLLDEQIAYYRARAAEYDATSLPPGDQLVEHAQAIRAGLASLGLGGRVIELAAGTGQWTGLLAASAEELVVTDASPEMLALNRAKVGDRPHIRYEVRDAFSLQALHAYDVVFIGFFLSHVPPRRFEAFWGLLEGILRRGGRVVFVDEGRHGQWSEDWEDEGAGIVRRELTDGTTHRAVKVLWEPSALEQALDELGWDASVRSEGPFYWGTAAHPG